MFKTKGNFVENSWLGIRMIFASVAVDTFMTPDTCLRNEHAGQLLW